MIVPPSLGQVVIVKVIGDGVLSVHEGDTQAYVGLPHHVVVMLQQFFNPLQAKQHAFVVYASDVLVDFH